MLTLLAACTGATGSDGATGAPGANGALQPPRGLAQMDAFTTDFASGSNANVVANTGNLTVIAAK